MATWKKVLAGMVAMMFALVVFCAGVFGPCWSGYVRWGVWVDRCPTGVLPRAHAEVNGFGRDLDGTVSVRVTGQLYDTDLHPTYETSIHRFSVDLVLESSDGQKIPLEAEHGWKNSWGQTLQATVKVPNDLPDDDYVLHVVTDTAAGPAAVDVPIPLFKPALAHTLTDAPLYRPGQVIRFRALLLGRGDLSPLESRPGTWKVWDQGGDLVLEERARTGAFGIVDSTFPLAPDAGSGQWTVTFESGTASDIVSFEVKEFKLPRFTIAMTPPKPWFGVGDALTLAGVATYSSGAPVARADVTVRLGTDGWPPPAAWLEPHTVTTDAAGKFEIVFGELPDDLRETSTLSAVAEVHDETGDSAWGSAALVVSKDAIVVDAVTELADGLVPDTNNRLYVRVTTPDGRPLPDAKLTLRRAWDDRDKGVEGATDGDAVAKFQLDPGQPITVTEPARPYRPTPRTGDPVELRSASEQPDGASLSLAEMAAVDRWRAALRPCTHVTPIGGRDLDVYVVIGPAGAVRWAGTSVDGAAARCVTATLRGQRAPAGPSRAWALSLRLNDPGTAALTTSVTSQFNGDVASEAFAEAAVAARPCVRSVSDYREVPLAWAFHIERGQSQVTTQPVAREVGSMIDGTTLACVARAMENVTLDEPVSTEAMGIVVVNVDPQIDAAAANMAPTTWPGFAFKAEIAGVGNTELRVHVGAVPTLRLRLSEVVIDPGQSLDLAAIRGPDWTGDFPKEMVLAQGGHDLVKFPFDKEKRSASFVVPADASGFASVEWAGARAVVYIRPKATLALSLAAQPANWRPGEVGKLIVTSTGREGPVSAGVTLSGVDSTMSAIKLLVPPDDFARVTVLATSDMPAFGELDAAALQTGQVSGINAAQATVLRISTLPTWSPGEDALSASGEGVTDLDTPLTDAFYDLYAVARDGVRTWEKTAPAGELLTAKKMVEIWDAALVKRPAKDPFGRPLRLSNLPVELRRLADPRVMVADASRLPEDVENWDLYISTESP